MASICLIDVFERL